MFRERLLDLGGHLNAVSGMGSCSFFSHKRSAFKGISLMQLFDVVWSQILVEFECN